MGRWAGPVSDGVVDTQPTAGGATARRRPSSWPRRILAVVVTLVVVGSLVFVASAWYLSGLIGSGALSVGPLRDQATGGVPDVVVTGAGRGWVELEPTGSMSEDLTSSYVYGLNWGTGFGWLRGLRSSDGPRASRSLEVLTGTAPTIGTAARVVRDAYPLDPGHLLGFPLHEVTYRSPAGVFPASLASGGSTTWAILVHGRGTTRAEMFRLMRVTVGLGMPSLTIAYRHDAESGGGRASFGQSEWADLDAAARWALHHGAHRLVLAGASMGGAVTAGFLERSELADKVVAVVLDAPALDFAAMIDDHAQDQSLPVIGTPPPGVLTGAATRLAALRYGLDLGRIDYLDQTSWVTAPILAFQGTADPQVPVSMVERLAAAEPDLVTPVYVRGAGHVESWNADPQAYDQQVRRFLRPLVHRQR